MHEDVPLLPFCCFCCSSFHFCLFLLERAIIIIVIKLLSADAAKKLPSFHFLLHSEICGEEIKNLFTTLKWYLEIVENKLIQ